MAAARPGRLLHGLALGLACAWSAPATAQIVSPPGDSAAFRDHGFLSLAVSSHPWSTLVAVTLVIPRGSAEDPDELSGAAWLLGEAVRSRAERSLDVGEATVTVEVGRAQTVLQALALPSAWEDAYDALLDAAFRDPIDGNAVERERASLLAVFRFESGAPVREFEVEFYGTLSRRGDRWGRDPRGTPESVGRITRGDLEDLRIRVYRPREAVVTVAGAVGSEAGVRVFPAGSEAGGTPRLGPRGRAPMWDDDDRRHLVREVTNSWIGVAFAVPPDVPRTLLEFIRHRLEEELNPEPADPDLFGSQVRIEELPGGTVLLIETAVLPEAQRRWEQRIAGTIERLGERHRDPGSFRWHRRRFRSVRLTSDGAPEAEGLRMALDLLREGRVRDLATEVWAMQPEQVEQAVDAFGGPRVLVFGPDLGQDGR